MSPRPVVVVVGAGFAGLAAADSLLDAGVEVVALEALDRVGGRVWSDRLANGGVVERGAEFVTRGYETMERYAVRLGLELQGMGIHYPEQADRSRPGDRARAGRRCGQSRGAGRAKGADPVRGRRACRGGYRRRRPRAPRRAAPELARLSGGRARGRLPRRPRGPRRRTRDATYRGRQPVARDPPGRAPRGRAPSRQPGAPDRRGRRRGRRLHRYRRDRSRRVHRRGARAGGATPRALPSAAEGQRQRPTSD